MSSPPYFSVLMSVYNDPVYVVFAIDSVLKQTFRDFEFIVVNDGSNEECIALLTQIASTDSRIRLFHNSNIGLTKSLNFGLTKAIGRYIARIDSDDLWHEEKLQRQFDYLKLHPQCVIFGTAYMEIDDQGRQSDNFKVPLLSSGVQIRNAISRFNPFFHSSVVIDRTVIIDAGGYDERFNYAQDYELWARIVARHDCANLPEVLSYRRLTGDNISIKKARRQKYYSLQARKQAIRLLHKPWLHYLWLINDFVVMILPGAVTKLVRKIKHRDMKA